MNASEKILAQEAAQKIKSLAEDYNTQIEQIYREFQQKVAAIREASTKSLSRPGADPFQPTENNR